MLACGVGVSRGTAADAVAKAVEDALAAARGEAEMVLLFTTGATADPRPALRAARAAAPGARLVGCAADGVLSAAGELDEGVVAVALAGTPLAPFLRDAPAPPAGRGLLLAFADAASAGFAAPAGWDVAGVIAAGPAPRWRDDEVSAVGLGGLFLGGEAHVAVTQACRPLGPVHVVTAAHGNVIETLDGKSAFAAFAEPARPLMHDLPLAAQTVLVAIAGDDPTVATDFAVRGVLQFDPDRGLLALSDPVAIGTRLRFAVRDAQAARADLKRALAELARRLDGRTPRLGFYFDGAGRGRDLYGADIGDGHDVAFIQGALCGRSTPFPLVGIVGGGQLGPATRVAPDRPRAHLFAGVIAVLP